MCKYNYNLEQNKYDIFFSLKNLLCVFRVKSQKYTLSDNSRDYYVESVREHCGLSPEDTLKDLFFLMRSASLSLRINDVVVIKTNGSIMAYRFGGIKSKNPSLWTKNFEYVRNFIEQEKTEFINELHCQNKVLDIINGKILDINSLDFRNYIYYGLNCEVFRLKSESYGTVQSEYHLYYLDEKTMITKINLGCKKAYYTLHNVFNFISNSDTNKTRILLLNRFELEMIKNYYALEKLVV